MLSVLSIDNNQRSRCIRLGVHDGCEYASAFIFIATGLIWNCLDIINCTINHTINRQDFDSINIRVPDNISSPRQGVIEQRYFRSHALQC
jgi:hypothetical protein